MSEQSSTDTAGARVTEELRGLLDGLAERAQPWLNQVREQSESHSPSSCGWCPLCAAVSLVRGDRPELAERLATHTLGLLGTLRAAMEPTEPGEPETTGQQNGSGHPEQSAHPSEGPFVQRITVERPDQA